MSDTRLNQRVFAWARRNALIGTCNNSYKVIHFLRVVELEHIIENNIIRRERQTLKREINEKLESYYISQWKDDINRETAKCGRGKNKLRTYRMFKHSYETESYVKTMLNRRHRIALAKIRCGVAPIRLETGRFERIPEEQRLCPICLNGDIETELHVITECSAYYDLRKDLFTSASFLNDTFNEISNIDKMCFILSDNRIANISVKACYEILTARAKITHLNNVNVNN